MTKSQLPSGLSEVHRPTKRARRSSSTSSTSSKTLQRQEWEHVDGIPPAADLNCQREQVSAASQSPPLPASRHLSSTFLPFFSSSNSSRNNTPSIGSTESRKDLKEVPAGEQYKEKLLDKGQRLKQEFEEEISTVAARSGCESFVDSREGSKQKTKEGRPIFKSTSHNESSEDECEGSDGASESGRNSSAYIMVGTPYQVREVLEDNNLFYDEDEARAPGAALIGKARDVINKKRGSDWSAEKRLQVMEGIEYCRGELESSFIFNLMMHLHGATRKVPQDKTLRDDELEQEYNWIEAAWKKDHLRLRHNVDFLTDCLPQIQTSNKHLEKLFKEVPRVQNPKPDVSFGINKTAFSRTESKTLKNRRCNLAGPRMYGIFFVIEAKCMNASIEEAENQCLRSGCAMVSTIRDLNQAASQARNATVAAMASAPSSSSAPLATSSQSAAYPKADMDSFAFTLAVGAQHAHLFVNWALEMDSNNFVEWHMHFLREYRFREPDDLNQLHHDKNNILDWGLSARKNELVDCCAKIDDRGEIQPSRKKQKTDRGDKSPDS